MAKIDLYRSYTAINNYEPGDSPELEQMFTVYDKFGRANLLAIEYIPELKQLRIPRGFNLDIVSSYFCDYPNDTNISDPYVGQQTIPIKYGPRDARQEHLMQFIVGCGKYGHLKNAPQIVCENPTGSGKTYVTVWAICTGIRAIIITSNNNWLDQWNERIMEYTPLAENQIYRIGGKGSINKLFAMNDTEILRNKIFLASHQTLNAYAESEGWDKIELLFKKLLISLKVYDEAHLYFASMARIDYHSNTFKTLYLSASMARSESQQNAIFNQYFKYVPKIEMFDPYSDPHVYYWPVLFNSHPTPNDIRKINPYVGFSIANYANYASTNEWIGKILIILLRQCLNCNGKVLIYAHTNNAILTFIDIILSHYPYLKDNIGIYSTANGHKKDPTDLANKIIFSTIKSAGAASDIYDLFNVINLADPFRSKPQAIQSLGRIRQYGGNYYDLVDLGFHQTKSFYKSKQTIYGERALEIKDEIRFSDEEIISRYDIIKQQISTHVDMCMNIYNE